jgi:hypothetical protein
MRYLLGFSMWHSEGNPGIADASVAASFWNADIHFSPEPDISGMLVFDRRGTHGP